MPGREAPLVSIILARASQLPHHLDPRRLFPAAAVHDLELHRAALPEDSKALAGDLRVMNEKVLAAVFGLNKAVALLVREPLDPAARQTHTSNASRLSTSLVLEAGLYHP